MPSASKYIVDINKISKPGNVTTGGIYIGTGSGNRESLYAVRGTGSAAVVIYDKVLYELEVDNITGLEPDVTAVTFTKKVSKKTHGNSDVDELTITPTGGTISTNTGSSEQTTTFTIYNCTGTTATGASVTVSVTQKADYVTSSEYSITATRSTSDNVSVLGETRVKYATISSKRKDFYKSGKVVDNISVNFKVKDLTNVSLTDVNGNAITTATTLADGTSVYITVSDNKHVESTRTCSFTAYCVDSTGTTATASWTQNKDSYRHTDTSYTTSFTNASANAPVTGGGQTFKFNLTRTLIYKWYSDDAYATESSDHTGSATISSSNANCTVTSTASNGDTVTATWGDNKHNTSTRTSTISANIGGASTTSTQNADSDRLVNTTVLTEWSTEDSSNIPTGGGERTAKWWTTRYHDYYWYSDDAFSRQTTDNVGTATLTATGGTLSRNTITNGQSVTITVGSSSSERTITIHGDIGNVRDISWTQEGQSLLTPSINWVNIAFASDPEPTPPPTTCVFSVQNDCNFDFYCSGIKSGSVWISPMNGDWDAHTETMENPTNVSIPFTITEVNGAISYTSIPPQSLTLSAESGGGIIVMERDPSDGVYRYSSGSITITNDDFEIVLN